MPTILLTGASGFLGSKILKHLFQQGYEIIILKRSSSNTSRIEEMLNKVQVYDIDIVDYKYIFDNHSIEIVIHTATNYGRKSQQVVEMLNDNLLFPIKLIEAFKNQGVLKFINTDTLLERHLSPYALTKGQFVEWGKRMAHDGKVQFVNLKLEHMYGPDDDESKFVTRIIRQLLNEVDTIPLTDGIQKRDFIHVNDVVNVYSDLVKLNLNDQYSEFEVGSGISISIKTIVEYCKAIVEQKFRRPLKTQLCFGQIAKRVGEPNEIKADTIELSKLGWFPKINLIDGLNSVIDSEIMFMKQTK